jgi:hypothetical protein
MNNSMNKSLLLITICFLFIFAGNCSVYAKTGKTGYEKADETILSRALANNAKRNEINRDAGIYCGNNSFSRKNIILADNNGNQDPIDSSELDDPVDRTELNDPVDKNDSEKNDPIDKEDRDHHPINSAERGQTPQGNDIDNDGDN